MCEGYVLEIGDAFRGSVVRSDTPGMPLMWIASVNATALGEYLDRGAAMRRVEEIIEWGMQLVLHDWELYKTAKEKR
jgi:hypothetical protein